MCFIELYIIIKNNLKKMRKSLNLLGPKLLFDKLFF